jgi:Flp pilus assembly protein TadD
MASALADRLRSLARRPRLAALTLVLLALVAYLGWLGGCALWVRWDRAEAEKALATYDFAEARRRLARCIRVQPHNPGVRLLAARTARRDGDLDFAREQLHTHRELIGGPSPDETLELALLTAQEGRVQEVVGSLIERLEEHHPESEHILEALAMGCVHNYELHRALFWLSELLEKDKWPKNGIGRLLYAQTTDTQGNREKAIALLGALVQDYPKYFKARSSLADMLIKSRRYREAAIEYAALLEQQPGEVVSLLGLASSYDRLGETEKAGPLMQQLETQYPNHAGVLLECGRFAMSERRFEDAERLLRRGAELTPYDNEVHRQLGMCLEQRGKPEESDYHFGQCRKIEADLQRLEKTFEAMTKSPNDPRPRREAGEICLRNGQVAEGLRWLNSALDLAPADKPTRRILADYFAAQGDAERASSYGGASHRASPDESLAGPKNEP